MTRYVLDTSFTIPPVRVYQLDFDEEWMLDCEACGPVGEWSTTRAKAEKSAQIHQYRHHLGLYR